MTIQNTQQYMQPVIYSVAQQQPGLGRTSNASLFSVIPLQDMAGTSQPLSERAYEDGKRGRDTDDEELDNTIQAGPAKKRNDPIFFVDAHGLQY